MNRLREKLEEWERAGSLTEKGVVALADLRGKDKPTYDELQSRLDEAENRVEELEKSEKLWVEQFIHETNRRMFKDYIDDVSELNAYRADVSLKITNEVREYFAKKGGG